MEDRAMIIRQQMDITKRNLTQRLATLEQQVTDKVQTAGTAVNATAEAVTDAVHSVGKAFDIERQFRRHPWLFVGGSVVLGYIVTELLKEAAPPSPVAQCADESAAVNNGHRMNGHVASADPANNGVSVTDEVRRVAVGAFSGIVRELAARTVPQVMSYFLRQPAVEESTEKRRSDSVKPVNV